MKIVRRSGEVRVSEIAAKSVLNRVHGMPFRWSINPYGGCAHQCVFCYARVTHAYRDLDGIDKWGSELVAKVNAPAVLRRELHRPGPPIDEVAIGTATDPYQAIEGEYRITRGILIELSQAKVPMHLITRSGLILRDIDILRDYAARAPVSVCISLPTLDPKLARELEPTVAPPAKRLAVVRRLAAAGIRVGVGIAPVLPELTDCAPQLLAVARAAADAGASFAWHSVLNLGEVTRDAFMSYLQESRPDLVAHYRAMYRSKYAPPAYVRSLHERFDGVEAAIRFDPPAAIVSPPRLPELSLFAGSALSWTCRT